MKRGIDIVNALLSVDPLHEACTAWSAVPDRYGSEKPLMFFTVDEATAVRLRKKGLRDVFSLKKASVGRVQPK